jgi:DNA-binding GntR family transcriptional regulator
MEHVRQRHQDIFDAVARRDAEAAQSAMEIHLHEVIRRYWQDVAPVV